MHNFIVGVFSADGVLRFQIGATVTCTHAQASFVVELLEYFGLGASLDPGDYLAYDFSEPWGGGSMKKSLQQWIRENREELDACIQCACPGAPKNDNERRLWVLNDEGLYQWARSERVNV